MEAQELVEAARDGGTELADSADGRLERPVPSCPGWTVGDLVGHVAGVCEFWTAILGGTPPGEVQFGPSAGLGEEIGHLRQRLDALLASIDGADPAARCWTWAPWAQNVGFVQRRMAQEMAIHRWDAANAVGDPAPVPIGLAVDGLDEFLHLFLGRRPAPGAEPVEGSVLLHATDCEGAGEWEIVPAPGTDTGFDVRAGHAKSDAVLRGMASDLLLTLWRRTDGAVEVLGDVRVARRFLAASTL